MIPILHPTVYLINLFAKHGVYIYQYHYRTIKKNNFNKFKYKLYLLDVCNYYLFVYSEECFQFPSVEYLQLVVDSKMLIKSQKVKIINKQNDLHN